MKKEIWKPVVGWRRFYEVSSLGRVRSLPRSVRQSNGVVINIKGRVLKTPLDDHGYPQCGFWRPGKYQHAKVHKVVCAAFIGRCPQGKEVRHKNGVRANCQLSNLLYGTRSENQNDRALHGTSNRGERCATAILTRRQVRSIRSSYANRTLNQRQLGEKYGVSGGTIGGIIRLERWAWL